MYIQADIQRQADSGEVQTDTHRQHTHAHAHQNKLLTIIMLLVFYDGNS